MGKQVSIELVTKKKLRKVELLAGAPRKRGGGRGQGPNRDERWVLDRERAQQAEDDYGRLVAERRT